MMQDNPFGFLFNLVQVYLLWVAFNLTQDEFLVGLIDGNEIDFVLPILLLPIVCRKTSWCINFSNSRYCNACCNSTLR